MPPKKQPNKTIIWRGIPPDILKEIADRRAKHMKKCVTCQFSMGKALEGMIRELQKWREVK